MNDEDPTWPTVDRRRQADPRQVEMQDKLDDALAEIQRLYGAATRTAEAVAAAIPRQEAEDRATARQQEQIRIIIVATAAHLLLTVLLLWAFSNYTANRATSQMERDHALLECLGTMDEASKVANPRAAITDCLTTAEE